MYVLRWSFMHSPLDDSIVLQKTWNIVMHANNAEHPAIQKSLNPLHHRFVKVIVKDDFKKYI